MRLDVVHAGSVPWASVGNQYGGLWDFMLFLGGGSQLGNFKGPDLPAIGRDTILGEAEKPAVVIQHSASGPGNTFISRNDGIARVFRPAGNWIIGRVKIE